jgi:hypothetical protein
MTRACASRSRWAAILGVLLASSLALSCGGTKSSSSNHPDTGSAGGGGAHSPDGAADSPRGTGGGPGGSGGSGTGGRSGVADAGRGGTTGRGGETGGGTTRTGGIGAGGAAGTVGRDAGRVGGSTRIDAAGAVGAGGRDASGMGGTTGAPGSGGVGGKDAGGTGGKPFVLDGSADGIEIDGSAVLPVTLAKCDDATDEQLRAVVYDSAKAPEPYDWDANAGGTLAWDQACAGDLAAARLLAKTALDTLDREDAESPYYYEFADETSRSYDQIYRVTKCEFFDGAVLGQAYRTPHGLGRLASYLWFVKNHNNGSAKIVAGAPGADSAPLEFFLCHTLTAYGDWGLYDEIRYYERRYTVDASGALATESDRSLRDVQGKYNPNPLGP